MPLAQRFNQNGKVIVMSETTDEPLTLAGYCAGVCWNADVSDQKKNFKRGLQCLKDGHGKVLEYAQVYLILDGWSARVIRELYTHQGSLPTKLQSQEAQTERMIIIAASITNVKIVTSQP